jgi:HEAT repeat protein
VTSSPKPPGSAGAEPDGSAPRSSVDGGASDLDPIFDAPEPQETTSRAGALLWQYFFFPVLMVAGAVGVFVAFGAWGGSSATEKELLETVMSGSENAQKQAAQQLAIAVAEERIRIDREAQAWKQGEPRPKPPFFAEPTFAEKLRQAYVQAQGDGHTEERRIWLAQALGRAADPQAVPLLVATLYPPGDAPAASVEVRRAAAKGLLFMESREAEPALVRAVADPDDPEVRATAANALALLGVIAGGAAADGPGTQPALASALDDPHAGTRLNAAVALAVRGDARGLPLLERALSREGLKSLDVPLEFQPAALANAVRAVVSLATTGAGVAAVAELAPLRGRIETLAKDDGDEGVRRIAREGLDRWRIQ